MNYDTADSLDDRYAVLVAVTGVMVLDAVREQDEPTIGSISRAIPEMYKHCVMSALKALKLAGEVDYNEFSPAPTRIYLRAMKRVERKPYGGYGKTAILPPKQKEPYPEQIFGKDFKGSI